MWHEETYSGAWWWVAAQSSPSAVEPTLFSDVRSPPKVCLNLVFFPHRLFDVFDDYNPSKTIWHWSDYAAGLDKYETAAWMIQKQAAKGEILLKCKFFQGFVPEACRVKLAFKHIGILMSWGASTSNLFRITMAMRRNGLLVHNAYICDAVFLQFEARLTWRTGNACAALLAQTVPAEIRAIQVLFWIIKFF